MRIWKVEYSGPKNRNFSVHNYWFVQLHFENKNNAAKQYFQNVMNGDSNYLKHWSNEKWGSVISHLSPLPILISMYPLPEHQNSTFEKMHHSTLLLFATLTFFRQNWEDEKIRIKHLAMTYTNILWRQINVCLLSKSKQRCTLKQWVQVQFLCYGWRRKGICHSGTRASEVGRQFTNRM